MIEAPTATREEINPAHPLNVSQHIAATVFAGDILGFGQPFERAGHEYKALQYHGWCRHWAHIEDINGGSSGCTHGDALLVAKVGEWLLR